MLRGQCQSQARRRVLGRCKTNGNIENVVIIDDDDDVIIDVPGSSFDGSKGLRKTGKSAFPDGAIFIDDDDGDITGASRDASGSTTRKNCPLSTNTTSAEEFDDDFFLPFQTLNFPSVPVEEMEIFEHISSVNHFGLDIDPETSFSSGDYYTFESDSSKSDNSDCEIIEDSSGNIREQWETAALRKKIWANNKFGSEKCTGISGLSVDPEFPSSELIHEGVNIENSKNKTYINFSSKMPSEVGQNKATITKENHTSTPDELREYPVLATNKEWISENCSDRCQSADETIFQQTGDVVQDLEIPLSGPSCNVRLHHDCASFLDRKVEDYIDPSSGIRSRSGLVVDHDIIGFPREEEVSELPLCKSQLPTGQQPTDGNDFSCSKMEIIERNPSPHMQFDDESQLENNIIGEREKHKESDEYKRAVEEEWASRQRQLQIQAEEVKQLRKRKKEERRTREMERRQKQRLEEMRESQKKDEETIHLKEKLRAEIQKELDKIEFRYRDMASLLRGLGIHVEGGLFPLSHEVNAAYKQALLRFHPDRSSRSDIRQQVEAEETFKLISRLKKTLLPLA